MDVFASRRMFLVPPRAKRMFCRIDSSVLWEAKEGAA